MQYQFLVLLMATLFGLNNRDISRFDLYLQFITLVKDTKVRYLIIFWGKIYHIIFCTCKKNNLIGEINDC